MKKILLISLSFLILFSCSHQNKQESVTPDKTGKEDPLAWYRNAKFGMFIHWGLFSLPAGEWKGKKYYGISEWLMFRAQIPVDEYKTLATEFNPVNFNAEEWVDLAVSAGMKYIIFTAKHCEGFSMFHSEASEFNIVDATPFKRDIVGELASACHDRGIKIGFYYPQEFEWLHPDARGNTWDYPDHKKDLNRYINEIVKPQLKELLTNYGEIGIIWFDVPNWITAEQSEDLVKYVHTLQPGCLVNSRVGNNLGDYIALGDHQLPDSIINRPFEVLFTHNDTWGYTKHDKNFKSPAEIIRLLVETSAGGGNFLLNVGPLSDGTLPAESRRMLYEVGMWMERNAEAIYGTGHSPFPDLTWGFCTSKPGVFYFHVFDWPENCYLRIPYMAGYATSVEILPTAQKLRCREEGKDLLLKVPEKMPDNPLTVIKVLYEGNPDIGKTIVMMDGCNLELDPKSAMISGEAKKGNIRWMEEFGDWKYAPVISGWGKSGDMAEWTVRFTQAGMYQITVDYSFTGDMYATEGLIRFGTHELYFQPVHTGDQSHHFHSHRIGIAYVETPGIITITIHPIGDHLAEFIHLRSLNIIPYN